MKQLLLIAAAALAFVGADRLDTPLATANNPMTVVLDARKASLGLAYTRMTIPVKPGPFTIVYPAWLPGDHTPDGPLNNISELVVRAAGKPIAWHRDQVDMYAFHIDVPSGVRSIDADYTVLLNGGEETMATRNVMIGNWNRYVVYQRNIDNEQYYVRASLILPEGWDYASALPVARRTANRIDFNPVTLETLVDSPTDMGRFVKHVTTWTGDGATTYLDMFADSPEDLDVNQGVIDAYKRLTPETMAFYGGRHWNVYHAELALSEALGAEGIEHHESSDNRAWEAFLTDPGSAFTFGDLIPHEFSHSWNGKYRRPYLLQQPNFNDPYPEQTELLWQYEGMNQYVGDLLSFRCGIRDPKDYPDFIASLYAYYADEPGRETTPLSDTTIGAPYYYTAQGWYSSMRRSSGDFYREGALIWLDADSIIREQSHGAKSLDDYAKVFAGGVSAPKVVTYTRSDIEGDLNQVLPYDWHGFFQKYIYTIAPQPPADELERAGYKLVYNDTPNKFIGRRGEQRQVVSWYDAGVTMDRAGRVLDVRQNSAAWSAGFTPTMTIVAVNGRAFTGSIWTNAIADAKLSNANVDVLAEQNGWYSHLSLDYHDGVKIPHLERIPGTVDMLESIASPHVH